MTINQGDEMTDIEIDTMNELSFILHRWSISKDYELAKKVDVNRLKKFVKNRMGIKLSSEQADVISNARYFPEYL